MARGGHRMLTTTEVARLQRRRAAGWTARQLVVGFEVSLRTVYRYLQPTAEVTVQARVHAAVQRWAERHQVELTPDQVTTLGITCQRVLDHELSRHGILR